MTIQQNASAFKQEIAPKPPARSSDDVVRILLREGPFDIVQMFDLFRRHSSAYSKYRINRLLNDGRIIHVWMPYIKHALMEAIYFVPAAKFAGPYDSSLRRDPSAGDLEKALGAVSVVAVDRLSLDILTPAQRYRALKEAADTTARVMRTADMSEIGVDVLARRTATKILARAASYIWPAHDSATYRKIEEIVCNKPARVSKPSGDDPLSGIDLGKNVDWLKPAGLLGDMADWIMTQMPNPNRPLAVAASLATMTPAVCWRNLYSPTGCALNGYYVGLGGTALGKDPMLKLPGRILHTVKIPSRLYSSSDAFSHSAQESVISDSPAIVLALDEIATNMFSRMFGARANSHETAMKGAHLKLFSRNIGDPHYGFTSRARGSISTLPDAQDPQFSMLAANTPKGFWEALPESTIIDGYLNRWLAFVAAPRATNSNLVFADVPEDFTESLYTIAVGDREGVNLSLRPKARQIEWESDSVKTAWEAMRDCLLPIVDAETTLGHLAGRTAEHAIRLATKHAIGCLGPDKAVVRMNDLHWGAAVAIASVRVMAAGSKMMAGSDYAKLRNEIADFIHKNRRVTLQDLARSIRWAKPHERKNALDDLMQAGVVEEKTGASKGGRKPTVYEWID
jgi:hypothetical protein